MEAVLIGLLTVSVAMDLLCGKIYNEWILLMLMVGLCFSAWNDGIQGLFLAIASGSIPLIILFPLFRLGGIGGGDVKLFMVVGSFLSIRQILVCMIVSFVTGAVMSLFKMLKERNLIDRLRYLVSYVCGVFQNKELYLYKSGKKEKIHFAPAVLIGTALVVGGII